MKAPDDKNTTPVAEQHTADNDVRATYKKKNNIESQIVGKKIINDKTRVALKRKAVQIDEISSGERTQIAKSFQSIENKTRLQSKREQNPVTVATDNLASDSDSDYKVLKNRFVLEKVLGSGGMGIVYKAKDLLKVEAQDRDPYVAIKVLSDEFKSHPEAFIALQRESRKSQRIAHPNIVNVHDFDKGGDTVFMSMEFMDGYPLDKLIRQYKGDGLPHDESWNILRDISAALIYAHEQNVIHSDFKPGNIFVTNSGIAKVFDFGIARAVAKAEQHEEDLDDRTVFDAGNLGALTPTYASLEMLEGEVPDVRDDVYALGCIAYELYTGEHPFNRLHADEAQRQKLKPKRISGVQRNKWLAIEKALAFRREHRTETVEEFWRQFSKKQSPVVTTSILVALLLILLAALVAPKLMPDAKSVSKEDFRNELEYEIRLELSKDTIKSLMAKPVFSQAWEDDLWREVQVVEKVLEIKDEWLLITKKSIFNLYIQKINANIKSNQLDRAKTLIINAHRYDADDITLEQQKLLLTEANKQEKKRYQDEQRQKLLAQQKQHKRTLRDKESAVRRSQFDAALDNVKKALTCKGKLNMRDLDIAIKKLRSLSMSRYQKTEAGLMLSLAQCIAQTGLAFPERAEEDKTYAMRIFESNRIIAGIDIVPRDPCDLSLAGLGARGKRAICKDKITGIGKGPAMVVIPSKEGIPAFAIGKYEISVNEINKFCAKSSICQELPDQNKKLPATNMTINTVNEYLKWLSKKTEREYRLPTQTEWRYASKADNHNLNPNRNCKLSTRGIQKGGSLMKVSVGQQNQWGLVNHVGNANEWVKDNNGMLFAVGGAYDTPMENCNFSTFTQHSGQADKTIGFRVLRRINKK